MDRPTARDTRRMNDPVESVGNRGEHRGERGLVGDIGRHEGKAFPEVLGRDGQVGPDDRAAFGQEPPRGGEADARGRSGHDECAGTARSALAFPDLRQTEFGSATVTPGGRSPSRTAENDLVIG